MENTGKVLLTSIHGLVGQQHLISHSESGSSGRLLWSARNKDQSREILKSACCSNKGTQFQTKGSISDGALRVTYYDSRGFVSCNFIFHVADSRNGAARPSYINCHLKSEAVSITLCCRLCSTRYTAV